MFVDEVTVDLRAGKGGNGCVSFRRGRSQPKGGPNGGNGGSGGDVVLICDPNVHDLTTFKFKPHARAGNGENGRGKDCNGRGGDCCELRLPAGTIVSDEETGRVVTELIKEKERVVLLHGGRGGRGNLSYKSSINRAPRQSTPGGAGEQGRYRLVLKTIADVGLVGFPNAGKSTFTNWMTHARRKTASYPFTTLDPHVGVIEYEEHFDRIHIADIPGLIEGAHENRGLGHRFLRHIERCRLLFLIIDMAGTDGRDPVADYRHLLEELQLYQGEIFQKPRIVAANKMDIFDAAENLVRFRKRYSVPIFPVSCLTGEGLDAFRSALWKRVSEMREE